ncbi:MAG TPA: hypothetical protein VK684_04830 [Edaphobacter sp.]|nr:hypothetical protein [Edaphobacter sp.]
MSIWPPPPDLESLKELFAAADIEGLIADRCPLDEYDPEAKHFYQATLGLPAAGFATQQTIPILEKLWATQFSLSEEQLIQRRPSLTNLAEQIERFFGPRAQPLVRTRS